MGRGQEWNILLWWGDDEYRRTAFKEETYFFLRGTMPLVARGREKFFASTPWREKRRASLGPRDGCRFLGY